MLSYCYRMKECQTRLELYAPLGNGAEGRNLQPDNDGKEWGSLFEYHPPGYLSIHEDVSATGDSRQDRDEANKKEEWGTLRTILKSDKTMCMILWYSSWETVVASTIMDNLNNGHLFVNAVFGWCS